MIMTMKARERESERERDRREKGVEAGLIAIQPLAARPTQHAHCNEINYITYKFILTLIFLFKDSINFHI